MQSLNWALNARQSINVLELGVIKDFETANSLDADQSRKVGDVSAMENP